MQAVLTSSTQKRTAVHFARPFRPISIGMTPCSDSCRNHSPSGSSLSDPITNRRSIKIDEKGSPYFPALVLLDGKPPGRVLLAQLDAPLQGAGVDLRRLECG